MNKFDQLYESLLGEAKGSKNWKAVLKSNPYVWIIFDPMPTQGSTGILVKKVGKDLSWKQLGSKYQGLTDTWNSGKAWELERDLKGQKYYVLDKHPDELNEDTLNESKIKKLLKLSDKKLGKIAQKTPDLTKLSDHEFFRAYDYWQLEDFENYDPTPEHIETLKRINKEWDRRSKKKLDFSKYNDKEVLELYDWYSGKRHGSKGYFDGLQIMLEPLHNEIIDRELMKQYVEDYVRIVYDPDWHNDRSRF